MSQVAEAFVRVRPSATGFGQELDRQLKPQLSRFENQMRRSNRELERFGRGALVGTGALRGLGRAAAFASTSFLGGAGLVFAIKSTIDKAMESQVVLGQTAQAVKRAGLSWETYEKQIRAAALAQADLSGFDDERLLRTFSFLVRRTGEVNKSLRLNALAADVARGANVQLEQAAKIVLRASVGQARGLAVIGIQAEKGATGIELLRRISEKYAGSAARFSETAAGAQARFNVALENMQEAIAEGVLPSITALLNKGTKWLNDTDNQRSVQEKLNKALEVGGRVATRFAEALQKIHDIGAPVVKETGGIGNAIEFAFSLLVLRRVMRFATAFTEMGTAATVANVQVATLAKTSEGAAAALAVLSGSIGTGTIGKAGVAASAEAATSRVALLRGALLRLGAIGVITITVDQIINRVVNGPQESPGGRRLPFGPDPADIFAKPLGGVKLDQLPSGGAFGAVNALTPNATATGGKSLFKFGGATAYVDLVSRNARTSAALAEAQAGGSRGAITAAANARLAFVNDTIAFANQQLSRGRGDPQKLTATLEKFFSEKGSVQGILQAYIDADNQATQKRIADQAAAFAKSQQLLIEQRAASKQGWEDYLAAQAAANLETQQLLLEQRNASKEGYANYLKQQAEIRLETLQNNVLAATLITDPKREKSAEITAQKVLVKYYKNKQKGLQKDTIEYVEAHRDYLNALGQLRNLTQKNKAAEGFSLQQLFAEATSELALYGSNIGAPGTPLSPQEGRGAFAGVVKAHQTVVVQNFHYPMSSSQALNDAHAGARNLKS